MISYDNATTSAVEKALANLRETREHEPHPLHPALTEVVDYVGRLQAADDEMAQLLDGHPELSGPERTLLVIKRSQVDSAVRRQALLVGRRVASDREGSLDTLNAIFKFGRPISKPLDGKHRGDVVALCMFPPLDAAGRALSRFWMPWLGKRFEASSQTGLNIFTPGVRVVGRLFWPTFSDYRPFERRRFLAFDFTTYNGMGVEDPEVNTLKLDYDLPGNPRFLIRTVLDEVTEITGNYYLGKAFLRGKNDRYKLAAFFALRRWES